MCFYTVRMFLQSSSKIMCKSMIYCLHRLILRLSAFIGWSSAPLPQLVLKHILCRIFNYEGKHLEPEVQANTEAVMSTVIQDVSRSLNKESD